MDNFMYRGYDARGKALQAGTSHFLGQKLCQSVDVKLPPRKEVLEYV